MKRTIALKLQISSAQDTALCELQATFSKACNLAASVAAAERETNRIRLHHKASAFRRELFTSAEVIAEALMKKTSGTLRMSS